MKSFGSRNKGEWRNWIVELTLFEEIKVYRCLKETSTKEDSIALYTFSDESGRAYTEAVYRRNEYQDRSITTRLIASKALSIPRFELLGAFIGLRLGNQFCAPLAIPSNSVIH